MYNRKEKNYVDKDKTYDNTSHGFMWMIDSASVPNSKQMLCLTTSYNTTDVGCSWGCRLWAILKAGGLAL